MAEIRGDLTVKVMNGVNLKNMDVFGTCNPYVLVKLRSSVDSMTTAVKDGEDNPSWQETFIFRGVACTDGLQISLMEKEGGREGVVSVAEYIPPSLWGFPGIGGAEREVQVTMPSTAGRKSDRPSVGTVVIRLQYRAELPLRPAFGLLKMAAVKTGVLTEKAKIDYAVGVIINLLQLSSRPVTMVGGMADNMTKTQKIATGSAIAIAGMGVVTGLMALAIPVALVAIFFLPVTVIGGFALAVMAAVLAPVAMLLGWIIFCTSPVQCRIWMPAVFWAILTVPYVNKILLKPRAPGAVQ